MPDAQTVFRNNIREADALAQLYDHLTSTIGGTMSFNDLLRSKLVYSVSAFDKLIHDLIRVGMVQTFLGRRTPTPKYLAEPIQLQAAQQLQTTITPPPEVLFEQMMRSKLKANSYQDPEKVADGLSYIWDETQKWGRISAVIGTNERTTRTTLKLIVARRNAIVHEADIDPATEEKQAISKTESDDVSSFILRIGDAICQLVT